jgi:DNA-binding MarR family transcriptional regulator
LSNWIRLQYRIKEGELMTVLTFNPMVNNTLLDNTFRALADPTRQQIIGMLVEPFDISFAAVSKHIKILERANLVTRTKRGREVYVLLNTQPMQQAQDWLSFYQQFWQTRFANLDKLLQEEPAKLTKIE